MTPLNTEPCTGCGRVPELLDEDLTCGPCRLHIQLGRAVTDSKKWTVAALHKTRSDELLIAAVFEGHRHDESSAVYTNGELYRFLRFVEAPTADAAERLVLADFDTAGLDDEDEEIAA